MHYQNIGTDVGIYCHGSVIGANDVVVRPIILLAMSIGKDNARGATRFVSEVCDPFNHSIGDRKFRTFATFDE